MEIFKECPMCSAVWRSRDEFIEDNSLVINGYQADFKYLEHGLFYFTHQVDGCFSTMALKAQNFYDLSPQNNYTERKTLTEDCPEHCLDKSNLQRCPAECECAYVREILVTLRELKEQTSPSLEVNKEKESNKVRLTEHG